jgi:hypothetical protein
MSDRKAHKRAARLRGIKQAWDAELGNAERRVDAAVIREDNQLMTDMARPSTDPDIIIQSNRDRFGTFSWQGQALQYDQLGEPDSIVYRRYMEAKAFAEKGGGPATIDTLLYYDEFGVLAGILNTYPYGAVGSRWIEEPGNVNTFTRPGANRGIGVPGAVHDRLMADARRRWPNIAEEKPDDMIEGRTGWRISEDGNRRFSRTTHLK